MKLYIPTSSLNFNNILSTESISPAVFYEKRGYGISWWKTIPENDIPNIVLLYDQPCIFSRPASDEEDHPLLIEYETDRLFDSIQDGVYYTDGTIYLNPWQTRIIFFAEQNKQTALSLSTFAAETKLLRLYERNIDVWSLPEGIHYPNVPLFNVPVNPKNIEFDKKVNKMKGLLYGYYIGACYSISDATMLAKTNILRELFDIFSSILHSIDKTPSAKQEERLTKLFISLRKYEPIYQEILNKTGDDKITEDIFSVFEKYILTEYRLPILFNEWSTLVKDMKKSPAGETRAMSWINQELETQNDVSRRARTPLRVAEKEIILEDCRLEKVAERVINDSDLCSIYKEWINNLLCRDEYSGKYPNDELSDKLTEKARGVLGNNWNNSTVQEYMNQLRRHIRGEEFNLPWNNGVLSSIASYLLWGDNWNKMLLSMQSKGMTDYRLAFSFYGILNGFANLTRDFTDLLLNLDSKYVAEVYKEFARQLLGETIKKQAEGTPMEEAPIKLNMETPNGKELEFRQKIMTFFDTSVFRNKNKLRPGLLNALNSIDDDVNYERFLETLANYEGWDNTKNPWKRMRDAFAPGYKDIRKIAPYVQSPKKKSAVTSEQPSLPFPSPSSEDEYNQNLDFPKEEVILSDNPIASGDNHTTSALFIDDAGAKDFISTQDYLPQKLKIKLAKQVKNLQERYEVGGKDANNPRDNENTINHFINWCFYDKGGFPPAVEKTPENIELLDHLKKDLLAYYDGR